MEIMLSHLGVGMAYDALDGLNIHAQRLHLRHIGVAAAVRREQADIARFFQRFAEYIPEMGGIAGQAGLGAFPDELISGITQLDIAFGECADYILKICILQYVKESLENHSKKRSKQKRNTAILT